MNRKLANADFEKLLDPFDATDIKYTNENEDNEFETKSFVANIKNNGYSEWIDNIKNSNEYTYDASFEDFTKDTDYGQIIINVNDEYITIEVKYNEELNESTTLTEGGIYPVMIEDTAKNALEELIDSIIGGDNSISDLELIPSLGFGGTGRYWYKTTITLSEEAIINHITKENTPEAYYLMNNGDLVINPYSDIDITCSADFDSYHDGVTLDAMNSSDADMDRLNKESNVIGSAIIKTLFDKESEIVAKLQEYEIPEDNELDESKSLKKENFNSSKVKTMIDNIKNWTEYDVRIEVTYEDNDHATINVYMPETDEYVGEWEVDLSEAENQDYAGSIADEINAVDVEELDENLITITTNSMINESNDTEITDDGDYDAPYIPMQEPINYNGFDIYKGINEYDNETYYIFFENDPLPEPGYEEWQAETIEIAKEWCDSYTDPDDEIGIYTGGDPNELDEREFDFESTKSIKEKISTSDKNKDTLIEQDTFGNYEENVFTALDNIEVLASSYEEFNADSLKTLITRLEDEVDTLKKINMKLITGIKQYTI